MVKTDDIKCETCVFFRAISSGIQEVGKGTNGQCHERPPQVLTVPAQDNLGNVSIGLHSQFPPVAGSAWCGQWTGEDSPENDSVDGSVGAE